jgi:hypothetical protein
VKSQVQTPLPPKKVKVFQRAIFYLRFLVHYKDRKNSYMKMITEVKVALYNTKESNLKYQ